VFILSLFLLSAAGLVPLQPSTGYVNYSHPSYSLTLRNPIGPLLRSTNPRTDSVIKFAKINSAREERRMRIITRVKDTQEHELHCKHVFGNATVNYFIIN